MGWRTVDSNEYSTSGQNPAFVTTGGTIITDGDLKYILLLDSNNFCVSNAGNLAGSNSVDYMVVAGGGGGGSGD